MVADQRKNPSHPPKRKMQDLSGATTRKTWDLPPKLRCKQKQKPSKEPRHWRNGLGPLEGWPPTAGQDNGDDGREHPRQCAGSQTPRSPCSPLPQRVPPTTPSRRWVRRDALRQRAARAGGGCRSVDQVSLGARGDARRKRRQKAATRQRPGPGTKNHPPRPPTPTRQETRKHRTGNERRRRKKKQVRGKAWV